MMVLYLAKQGSNALLNLGLVSLFDVSRTGFHLIDQVLVDSLLIHVLTGKYHLMVMALAHFDDGFALFDQYLAPCPCKILKQDALLDLFS